MKTSPRRAHTAFTLVEMLVVIVIIGILAAILVPTVYRAFTKAVDTRTALELSQIAASVEQYKQEHGDYPPNFSDFQAGVPWTSTDAYRHVRKAFPRAAATELTLLQAQAGNIDNAEALVFWIGGLSSDPQHPFTGPGGPIAIKAGTATVGTERRGYSFVEARLTMDLNASGVLMSTDGDNDAFPVYLPQGQEVPYVYFESRQYGFFDANNRYVYNQYPAAGGATSIGVARPMKDDQTNPNYDASKQHSDQKCYYVNRETFQIISAGQDNHYGEDFVTAGVPVLWHYPSGNVCHPDATVEGNGGDYAYANGNVTLGGRLDNITNFSEGTLEDQLP